MNLQQAVDKLVEIIITRDYLEVLVKEEPEEEFTLGLHMSLGRWIRNTWELWDPESALSKHFSKLGITHADDMSSIIMTCAHRQVLGKKWKLPEQIKHFKDYWKEFDKKLKKEYNGD